jgi:hypothetical protein
VKGTRRIAINKMTKTLLRSNRPLGLVMLRGKKWMDYIYIARGRFREQQLYSPN